jgi:glucokinase
MFHVKIKEDSVFVVLVMDIGGTNIRLGLLKQGEYIPTYIKSFKIKAFVHLADVVTLFLSDAPDHQITDAAISVATPVMGDHIKLTNYCWEFSIAAVRAQFGWQRLKVVNDFAALALSLPLLRPIELQQMGGGQADAAGTIGLLGAGTGLGVSGLVATPEGWYPLSGEGGHVTLGARNARELAIFSHFWTKYGHMSAERLLSGMGLVEVYQVICALDGVPDEALDAAAISQRAMAQSCGVCAEVMALFCECLGVVAGNLVLSLGASGGLYIGGGIIPQLGDFFVNSAFRQAFEAHGRFRAYLEAVPVYVIHADQAALRGAAHSLDTRFSRLGVNCVMAG